MLMKFVRKGSVKRTWKIERGLSGNSSRMHAAAFDPILWW